MNKNPLTSRLKNNLRIIYIFNFLKGLMFFLPIYALYLQQELYSVLNVTIILAIGSIATTIFEVPSGAIADLFGRKKTLIIASIISVVALGFLIIGHFLMFFIIYAILNALSRSLVSGTDVALLFDSIKELNKVKDKTEKVSFKKAVAINHSMWPIGASISSIIGGLIAINSLREPIIATIIPFSIAGIILFSLIEPTYKKEKEKNIFKHIIRSTKKIISKKQVLLLSIAGFLFFSFGEVAHQLNPIFFEFKGISIKLFGIIFASTFGLSALGSLISHKISNKLSNKKTIIISAIIPPFLLFSATLTKGIWSGILIVLGSLFWGIRWPIITHLLNIEVESKQRSTVMSIGNLANKLGLAIFAPIFGYLADLYSINTTFKLIAILSTLVVGILFFIEDKN